MSVQMNDSFYVDPNFKSSTPPIVVQETTDVLEEGIDESDVPKRDRSANLRFASLYGFSLAVFSFVGYFANQLGPTPGEFSFLAYAPGVIVGGLGGVVCARAARESIASLPANIFTTLTLIYVVLVTWVDSWEFVW
jgi:hypothetical protein